MRGYATIYLGMQYAVLHLTLTGQYAAARALLGLMTLDTAVFLCFGPSPSPVGLVSQAVLWRFRGPSVPSLPYKFIWLLYIISSLDVLTCSDGQKACAGGQAAMMASVVNTLLIALLRF